MALLKDLYRLTKYVDKTDDTDKVLVFGSYEAGSYPMEVADQYAQAQAMSKKKAKKLLRVAYERHYLTFTPLNERGGPPNKVILDTAGYELIDKTVWGLFPKGLWLAWASKNTVLITLIWLFVGAIIARLDDIIKFIALVLQKVHIF